MEVALWGTHVVGIEIYDFQTLNMYVRASLDGVISRKWANTLKPHSRGDIKTLCRMYPTQLVAYNEIFKYSCADIHFERVYYHVLYLILYGYLHWIWWKEFWIKSLVKLNIKLLINILHFWSVQCLFQMWLEFWNILRWNLKILWKIHQQIESIQYMKIGVPINY